MERAQRAGTDGRLQPFDTVFLVVLRDAYAGGDLEIVGDAQRRPGKHGPRLCPLLMADTAIHDISSQGIVVEAEHVELLVEVKEAHPPVQALPGRVFQTKLLA